MRRLQPVIEGGGGFLFLTLVVSSVHGINDPNSELGLYRRHQGLLARALSRHHQSTPVQRRTAVKSKGGAECSGLGTGIGALNESRREDSSWQALL